MPWQTGNSGLLFQSLPIYGLLCKWNVACSCIRKKYSFESNSIDSPMALPDFQLASRTSNLVLNWVCLPLIEYPFLLFGRKKKSQIMLDYQGFAWFFFCFQWSAWVMNLAVYSPINQYLWSYKPCTCHVLVLKNCPLLSSACLLISWVQKYAFFLDYANHW